MQITMRVPDVPVHKFKRAKTATALESLTCRYEKIVSLWLDYSHDTDEDHSCHIKQFRKASREPGNLMPTISHLQAMETDLDFLDAVRNVEVIRRPATSSLGGFWQASGTVGLPNFKVRIMK